MSTYSRGQRSLATAIIRREHAEYALLVAVRGED